VRTGGPPRNGRNVSGGRTSRRGCAEWWWWRWTGASWEVWTGRWERPPPSSPAGRLWARLRTQELLPSDPLRQHVADIEGRYDVWGPLCWVYGAAHGELRGGSVTWPRGPRVGPLFRNGVCWSEERGLMRRLCPWYVVGIAAAVSAPATDRAGASCFRCWETVPERRACGPEVMDRGEQKPKVLYSRTGPPHVPGRLGFVLMPLLRNGLRNTIGDPSGINEKHLKPGDERLLSST
jgi:hypothetical protein